MPTADKTEIVTIQELLLYSLATAEALAKILIKNGLISQTDFMGTLSREKAMYQVLLRQKLGNS